MVARAVRRDAGLWGFERALQRQGFELVAGADEAGRGACAGPLVVAAVVLPAGRRGQVPGLADSKLLTFAAREEVYAQIVRRAVCWSVVVIPSAEVDRRGLHVINVEGMRRAVAGLEPAPDTCSSTGSRSRGSVGQVWLCGRGTGWRRVWPPPPSWRRSPGTGS